MTAALNAKVNIDLGFTIQGNPAIGQANVEVEANANADVFTTGSAAGQIQNAFADNRQLAASGNETLDLYGGLTDGLGRTVNFAGVKAIVITADAANGGNITIGAAATHPFLAGLGGTTPTITLPPGAKFALENPAGWAITDATNDSLKIANSDSVNPGKYKIKIIG